MAAEILQKPNYVVLAFMHILHLKKMCARLHCLAIVSLAWLYVLYSVCSIAAAAVCLQGCSMHWLGVVSLTRLYCSVCNIVAAAVCLHVCSVCSVVAAGFVPYTVHGYTWLYCLQRDNLGHQSNDTACHALF